MTRGILSALLVLCAVGASWSANHLAARQSPTNPDLETYTGLYRNESWGYEVTIPKGFVGEDSSAGPRHGFGMTFGGPPESFIVVLGEANSLEYRSAFDSALKELSFLRDDKYMIDSAHIQPTRLRYLEAAIIYFTDSKC